MLNTSVNKYALLHALYDIHMYMYAQFSHVPMYKLKSLIVTQVNLTVYVIFIMLFLNENLTFHCYYDIKYNKLNKAFQMKSNIILIPVEI